MKKVVGLQVAATTVGFILVSCTYISLRNNKRDKTANLFLEKLRTVLNPISKGLLNEVALDENYKDKVMNSIASRIVVLKGSTATRYAAEIHKAFKPWYKGGDLEENVYGVFRSLKDKVQVSQVAKAYQRDFDVSLKDRLKERFDTDEIKTVLEIISRLPNFRKL